MRSQRRGGVAAGVLLCGRGIAAGGAFANGNNTRARTAVAVLERLREFAQLWQQRASAHGAVEGGACSQN